MGEHAFQLFTIDGLGEYETAPELRDALNRLGIRDQPSFLRLVAEHNARVDAEQQHVDAVSKLDTQVSAETARVVQATVNRIASIEQEFGLLSNGEVAELLGSRGEPRSFTADLRKQRRVLYLPRLNKFVYPGFQFDADRGAIKPVIAPLLELAERYERKVENVSFWLVRETTYLDDRRPVDLIDEQDALLELAEQAWSVDW